MARQKGHCLGVDALAHDPREGAFPHDVEVAAVHLAGGTALDLGPVCFPPLLAADLAEAGEDRSGVVFKTQHAVDRIIVPVFLDALVADDAAQVVEIKLAALFNGVHQLGAFSEEPRRLGDADRLASAHRDRLEVLGAHHGAHAGAPGGASVIVDHAGEPHQFLSGGADTGDLNRGVGVFLLYPLARLVGVQAPEVGGVEDFNPVVGDHQVDRLFRPPVENHAGIARVTQFGRPETAGIAVPQVFRERRLGADVIARG